MRAARSIWCALLCLALLPGGLLADGTPLDSAKQAYAKGEYSQAIEILKGATAKDPNNGELYALLSRSYLELDQYDAAVSAGEKAVALSPNNSVFTGGWAKRTGRRRIMRRC